MGFFSTPRQVIFWDEPETKWTPCKNTRTHFRHGFMCWKRLKIMHEHLSTPVTFLTIRPCLDHPWPPDKSQLLTSSTFARVSFSWVSLTKKYMCMQALKGSPVDQLPLSTMENTKHSRKNSRFAILYMLGSCIRWPTHLVPGRRRVQIRMQTEPAAVLYP